MGKLRTTLDLARSSGSVLKADKELLVLPLLSGVASLLVAASFVVPLFLVGGADAEPTPVAYVLLFVMYVVLAIITTFSNAALIAGAHERLQGGDPTVRSVLGAASARLGQILPWAVISATVSVVLQAARQRGGAAGAGAAAAAGLAWSLVTFLVLPIIVVEGLPIRGAIGRSKDLFTRTWGENVAARVGFGGLGFVLALPAVLLVLLGAAAGTVGLGIAIAVAVIWLVIVTLVMAALSAIFQGALYLHASGHQVSGDHFTPGQLDRAVGPAAATQT
jgi:hypothetical protein